MGKRRHQGGIGKIWEMIEVMTILIMTLEKKLRSGEIRSQGFGEPYSGLGLWLDRVHL